MLKTSTKSRLISIIILLTLLTGLLGGCKETLPEQESPSGPMITDEERFDILMDELFEEYVVSDSLAMNYNLADPGSFGIDKPNPATYGDAMTPGVIAQSMQDNKELADLLDSIKYSELRQDQQIVYDILVRKLRLLEVLEGKEEYFYYLGEFFPTSGVHVQLPVILAEFRFYNEEDIGIYLELLEDTRRFFDEEIEFERERSARGFFLSNANVDEVVAHCESFLGNREDNLLIEVFNDKLDNFEGISNDQRTQYKQKNAELVLGNVLPSYEALKDAMLELKGKGANEGGLAALPDGKKYAEAYLRYKTGSDRSPKQMEDLIVKWMGRLADSMSEVMSKNPDLLEKFYNGTAGEMKSGSPEGYLIELEKAVARDFPAMDRPQYALREVHESLQEFMSPAFYLIPALDYYHENVIYINPGTETDDLGMFTTLGHEGYPGHMYQIVYFLQQSPHPVRTVLNHLGYDEGWATYAEMSSYMYSGLAADEAMMMQYSAAFDLLFISRLDLGVNALGWGMNQFVLTLAQFGIEDPEVTDNIYQTLIGYPLHYLPYSLGYLEMLTLREEAMEALGDSFDLRSFHSFILDFGPAPFPLIRTHMQDWVKSQQSVTITPAA